jgi:hypothetical protein
VNAFVIWRGSSDARKDVTQLDFTVNLMKQLVGESDQLLEVENDVNLERNLHPGEGHDQNRPKRAKRWARELSRLTGDHYMTSVSSQIQRSLRIVCRNRRITSKCVVCNAFLCYDGVGEENCFWRFHHLENFAR